MAGARGAFEAHLLEAIALNRERAPRYASLSDGESRIISRMLIMSETLLIPVARWFDRRALPYAAAGVPLLHDVFVSMSLTPAFSTCAVWSPQRAFDPTVAARAARRVKEGATKGGFVGAATAIQRELHELEAEPRTNAMLRHLLESARRVAMIAPRSIQQSAARELPDPSRLLGQLLSLHVRGLRGAGVLDRLAYPLQLRGIPILAQDVPPIREP